MKRLTIVWVFVAAWLAVSCASADPYAGAEDVTYGSWSGTLTPTGAETIDISYVIKQQATRSGGARHLNAVFGNAGHILLPSGEEGGEQQIEMTDIEVDGTTLKYSWTDPQGGTQLSCELVQQTDTLLSGDCLDPSGATVSQMTMSPPPGTLGSN